MLATLAVDDVVDPHLLGGAAVKLLRRAALALSLASVIGAILRVRGRGGVPPQEGGWTELHLPPR